MAKLVTNAKKKNGIVKLKTAVGKLQRSLSLGRRSNASHDEFDYEAGDDDSGTSVPGDIKEGHFAVVAVDAEEPKRFVAPLSCLTNPTFLRLLEAAAEEYGFDHEGALTVPCRPSEMERILAEQWGEEEEESGCIWG
ncbi:auxin-responsive protein SAUR50-like [Momordica charantia]|uniref:Auxin-responsive protein SAUR50-like n=1 Tax=Momordica charantia TaxID=3673 RepID=A0A6J1CGW5_MOMCH|nr:auxin-responsive protein SAUR50-like [Momordica charantia]